MGNAFHGISGEQRELFNAALALDLARMRAAVERGADPAGVDAQRRGLIHLIAGAMEGRAPGAGSGGAREVGPCLDYALSLGWGVDDLDAVGMTPMRRAAMLGDAEAIRALAARGASVGMALHSAAAGGARPEAVEALLAAGADPWERGPSGMTALDLAASSWGAEANPMGLAALRAAMEAQELRAAAPAARSEGLAKRI